jgi:hypothetical protein
MSDRSKTRNRLQQPYVLDIRGPYPTVGDGLNRLGISRGWSHLSKEVIDYTLAEAVTDSSFIIFPVDSCFGRIRPQQVI